MSKSHLRRAILDRAAAPGGVGTKDVPGYTVKQVGRAIANMVETGRLLTGKTPGRRSRYFTVEATAIEYSKSEFLRAERGTAGFSPWGPDEPVVYLPNYKHTIYPPSRMGEFVTNTHKDW